MGVSITPFAALLWAAAHRNYESEDEEDVLDEDDEIDEDDDKLPDYFLIKEKWNNNYSIKDSYILTTSLINVNPAYQAEEVNVFSGGQDYWLEKLNSLKDKIISLLRQILDNDHEYVFNFIQPARFNSIDKFAIDINMKGNGFNYSCIVARLNFNLKDSDKINLFSVYCKLLSSIDYSIKTELKREFPRYEERVEELNKIKNYLKRIEGEVILWLI